MHNPDMRLRMVVSWMLGLLSIGAAVFDYFQMTLAERLFLFLMGVLIIVVF